MYLCIFMAVVGILLSLIFSKPKGRIDHLVTAILGAFSGLLIGATCSQFLGEYAGYAEREEPAIKLASMHGYEGVSGSFFLGTGSINSRTFYKVMRVTDDGGYRLITLDPRNVVIHEDESLKEEGSLTAVIQVLKKEPWIQMFATEPSSCNRVVRYEIRVPKGSIVHEFKP